MTKFGRYEVQRLLHRGTAADTLLCLDGGGERVVIKVRAVNDSQLRARIAADPAVAEHSQVRFAAERELLAALRHPNVVELLDFGSTAAGAPYFVMPFLETGLADLLRPHEVVTEPRVAREAAVTLLRDVLAALAHAHSRGVVHRDIRPANLRLTASGSAVVCDFGSAKGPGIAGKWYRPIGVRPFASPEQLIAPEAADARADVHAVGVLAHLLFTGYMPGPAAVASGALHRRVGRALGDWTAAAMSPAREHRPATAAELLAGLNQAAGA